MADLITHYLIQNHGALPASQFDIYDDYIRHRLQEDAALLSDLSLTFDDLIAAATAIAWTMYNNSDIGLDVDLAHLKAHVQIPDFDSTIIALRSTRIARVGGVHKQTLSFVHRRFAEFFVVRAIVNDHRNIPLDAIPEDSRWRDCLVVYCGVAPANTVQPIANFCWSVIGPDRPAFDNSQLHNNRPAIHALRFLRDAFVGKVSLLSGFQDELSRCILRWIGSPNFITAKVAAEALGLLPPRARSDGIAEAFARDSLWINETALNACRHLGGLEVEAKQAIRRYVKTIPVHKLFSSYRDLSFGFSLSEDLRFQRWALRFDIVSLISLWIAILLIWTFVENAMIFLAPLFVIAVLMDVIATLYPSILPTSFRNNYRPGLDSSVRLVLLYGLTNVVIVLLFSWMSAYLIPGTIIETFKLDWSGPGSIARKIGTVVDLQMIMALCLFVLVVVPWEWWLVLTRLRWASVLTRLRWVVNLRQFLRGVMGVGLALAFPSVTAVAVFGMYYYFPVISDWIARAFVVLALIGVAIGSILALLHFIRDLWQRFIDWTSLRRLVVPDQVDRAWVYQVCRSLKSSGGRARFLEILRHRNVEATDEPEEELVEHSWMDERVREGLARLEAVWQGLEE